MAERGPGEVFVVGSANVDLTIRAGRLPASGETVIGGVFSRQAGGKGANQAIAAARYGGTTRFVAAVGDDPLADEVVDALRAAGVGIGGVARLPDMATGVALIVVDAQGENQIAVASGANGALSGSLVTWALGSVEPGPWSVCLIGFEIGDEAVVAAAAWAQAAGVSVIVNPAPARSLPAGLLAMAPILTPNRAEAMALTGSADPADAARVLQARSGAAVVVTLGADGALVLDHDGETHVPALTVIPVDTTGAGDVFNGILAAELSSGTELRTAARLAVAGASLSTCSAGAQAGLPTRDEVAAALAP